MAVTNFARRSYQLESQNLYFCSRFFLQMLLLDCMVVLAVTDVAFSFTESSYWVYRDAGTLWSSY